MSKHTPGPWYLAEAATSIPIKSASGKTVATIRYRDHDGSDANLIAAAPDLLAALKQLRDSFLGTSVEVQGDAMRIARAAIAKAEGPST